jgi:hypothetical protein
MTRPAAECRSGEEDPAGGVRAAGAPQRHAVGNEMAAWLRLPKVSDSGFGTGLAKLIAIDREHLSQTQAPDADEPVATRRRTVTHAGLRAACRSAAGRATGARDRLAAMCAATALRAGLERTPWFARIWTPAIQISR